MKLITGNLGFIGSHLTKEFKKKGIEYRGYDINNFDHDDIRDKFKLEKVFAENNIDCVIHLAARAGVRMGEEYPEEFLTTNVLGTENILKMCQKYKANKAILFSSSSVYGRNNEPISFYGMTKKMMEMLVIRYKIPSIFIVRPFTVYGENGRKDQVIFKWINQIKEGKPITFYGEGNVTRWYTYVGDLVDSVMAMIKYSKDGINYVDVAGNKLIRLNELLEIFKSFISDIDVDRLPLPDIDKCNMMPSSSIYVKPKQDFKKKVEEIIKKEFNI